MGNYIYTSEGLIPTNELKHYGVLGMKWGVRRYQNKDGSLTAAGKRRYSEEAKSMSNEELRKSINRMNLEKRYYDMTKSSKRSNAYDTIQKASSAGASATKTGNKISQLKGGKSNNIPKESFNAISKSASAAKKVDSIITDRSNVKKNKSMLESLSDKEIQELVDRIDLEQQYSSLKKSSVNRGKFKVSDVLDVAGDVLAVGASAASIALAIHAIRKKA